MSRRFILAGHSHAHSLGITNPSVPNAIELQAIDYLQGKVLGLSGPAPRTPAYWDALVREAKDSTVLLVWNGNQHLAKFLFEIDRPFDFFLASQPAWETSEADIVPEAQVREALDGGNAFLYQLLGRLKEVPGCRVVLLGTPPPKGDDARLRHFIQREAFFVQLASKAGSNVNHIRLTDRSVRLKLWTVIQDLLAEAADNNGCAFLSVPDGVKDEDGFLRGDLWFEDATHANPQYGHVFWETMLSRVGAA